MLRRAFPIIESEGFEGPGAEVSPAEPIMTSQELIEEILLDAARSLGLVDVRFSTEVTKLIAGGAAGDAHAAVAVRSRTTGAEETVAGAALVAADVAASSIRRELGLRLEGVSDLMHIVNCYFRADIERHIGDRKGVLFFVSNERAAGADSGLTAEQIVTESRRYGNHGALRAPAAAEGCRHGGPW